MNRRRWLQLALLFSLVVVAAVALPTTLSYVFSTTGPVVNTFLPPGGLNDQTMVEVFVEKTVLNTGEDKIGPEGFTFILKNDETGEELTVVTGTAGTGRFALPFSGTDAGKTFSYSIWEQNDARENVVYDSKVYVLEITIGMVDDKPVATLQLDGQPVTEATARFENTYHFTDVPETGDASQVTLYAALAVGSMMLLILLVRRRRSA